MCVGLRKGNLVVVHDGSFMPYVSHTICSAAFAIQCTSTGNRAFGTVLENISSADNFHAELLGGLMAALVMKTTTSYDPSQTYLDLTMDCDNDAVVSHGNTPNSSLKAKQNQVDVIHLYKSIIRNLSLVTNINHVDGHLDDILHWDQLLLSQQLNCFCDSPTKDSLITAFLEPNFILSCFPFEDIYISVNSNKFTDNAKKTIYRH